jgi:cation transport protein ChaC
MIESELSWVFGHGSLMFRPGFPHVRRETASVDGWERRFGQPSVRNWGTEAAPAPTSSLVPGGTVTGVAFGVPANQRDQVFETLNRREAQDPIEVSFGFDGRLVTGLTWPMSSEWADLTPEQLAAAALGNVEAGGGPSGHAIDYLNGVFEVLTSIGALDELTGAYRMAVRRLTGP